ncbi:MAG: dihydrodipicolinate synthase family protein [Lentisphaerae bacterium]|nr:dihydrodipicolinate synthase family protein [Lentisphaerota bacterium]
MFAKEQAVFITAVGTPLNEDGDLVEESFRRHLSDQLANGIDGLLVMGTMGMMPCLKAATYRQCAQAAVAQVGSRAKVMVGIGDNSIERTMERVELLEGLKIDAVAATTPYYFPSSQHDLLDYFRTIAERSPFPLYLYDLPQLTKVKIELDTVLELSAHRNIRGIKCSHDPVYVRRLFDRLGQSDFELICSQYDLTDFFLAYGIMLHLDGFFSVMPSWLKEIKGAYQLKDFKKINAIQRKMTALRSDFFSLGVFPAFSEAMNLLGFAGRFFPSHLSPLAPQDRRRVKELLVKAGLLA